MEIRPFAEPDWPSVRPIVTEVVAARDTDTYDPAVTEEQALDLWIAHPTLGRVGLHVMYCPF